MHTHTQYAPHTHPRTHACTHTHNTHHTHTHTHTCNTHVQGKLKYNEHVTEGFDNIFDAFVGLFKGDNVGKAVIKA